MSEPEQIQEVSLPKKRPGPDKKYWWKKGQSGNLGGFGVVPPEERILRRELKKWTRLAVAEHERKLAEALPLIRPALVTKASHGELGHIQEIHKVVGAYKDQETPTTAIQVNFGEDKSEYK